MELSFRYFRLGFSARMAMAAVLYATAIALQTLVASAGFLFIPAVAGAWVVLALKPVTNKPKDQGLEEWRAVSDTEIDRIADAIRRSKKLRATVVGPVLLGVVAFILVAFIALIFLDTSMTVSLALFDLALFSVPGLFFGRVRVFTPAEMDLKLPCFLALMEATRPKGYVLTPYLRFDKDDEGRDVPEDIRFLLEPSRKPEDLVGVQFQAAINNGANGRVPYLYAVVLTRGREGSVYRALSPVRVRGYSIESGGDGDYGTVVFRQDTDGGGYYTDPDACLTLFMLMLKALERVV